MEGAIKCFSDLIAWQKAHELVLTPYEIRYTSFVAKFTYTARRNDGEVYNGIAEAQDRFELYEIIRKEGGHLLSMQSDKSTNKLSLGYWIGKITTVPEQQKNTFHA